jgi:preprotein translocase SecE subunit
MASDAEVAKQDKGANQGGSDTESRSGNFIRASIEELRKVTSPSRQETVQATVVTVFILFFVAICLFVVDVIFSRLMGAIIG